MATEDGGPRDIVANCHNGLLVNPLDADAIAIALTRALGDSRQWRQWSQNGLRGTRRHYTWESHVRTYLRAVEKLLAENRPRRRAPPMRVKSRLPASYNFV